MWLLLSVALAEQMVIPSLEWTVTTADAIVIASGIDAETLHIDEVLWYDPTRPHPAWPTGTPPGGLPETLHLRVGAPGTYIHALSFEGQDVRVSHIFGASNSLAQLRGAEVLATGELLEPNDREAIETAVRTRIQANLFVPDAIPIQTRAQGEAARRGYSGSGVSLLLPPDPDYLPMLKTWLGTDDRHLQLNAAYALRNRVYLGSADEELRALLHTAPSEGSNGRTQVSWHFTLREAVWRALIPTRALPDPSVYSVETILHPW